MPVKTIRYKDHKNDELHYSDYNKLGACYLSDFSRIDNPISFSQIERSLDQTITFYTHRIFTKDGYVLCITTPSKQNQSNQLIADKFWVKQVESYIDEDTVSEDEDLKSPIHKWHTVAQGNADLNSLLKKISVLRPSTQQIHINPLENLIENAKSILNLPFDWNDEGALTIDETTFNNSTSFLKQYVNFISNYLNTEIKLPEINPCPDGSIDLEWHTDNAQLLINIRQDKEGNYTAFYYGDRHNNKMQIKGSTPVNEFSEHLAVWMKYLA